MFNICNVSNYIIFFNVGTDIDALQFCAVQNIVVIINFSTLEK